MTHIDFHHNQWCIKRYRCSHSKQIARIHSPLQQDLSSSLLIDQAARLDCLSFPRFPLWPAQWYSVIVASTKVPHGDSYGSATRTQTHFALHILHVPFWNLAVARARSLNLASYMYINADSQYCRVYKHDRLSVLIW